MVSSLLAATWLQTPPAQASEGETGPLLWAASILLVIVLVVYPAVARLLASPEAAPPRGLNLPRGSVRSMLALLIVGAFVVVAIFGAEAFEGEDYQHVITILGTLAGPILGFYFGSRNSQSRLDPGPSPPSGQAAPHPDSAGESHGTSG